MRFFRKQVKFTNEENSAIQIVSEIYLKSVNNKIEKDGATDGDLKVRSLLDSVVTKAKLNKV